MKNKHIYFIILAGGHGKRLWPLSRKNLPKQLLRIGQGKTLLEQAIDRIKSLAYSYNNIWVSTIKDHEQAIHAQLNDQVGNIHIEPLSRNTAASILYCCYELQKHDPHALAIFLPADAFIPIQENALFEAHIKQIIQCILTQDVLTLSGIKPIYAAPEYGYIRFDKNQSHATGLHQVIGFHEKPQSETLKYYMQTNNILWNIGIFGAKVSVFIDAFKHHAPILFEAVGDYCASNGPYGAIPNISVDCAIFEYTKNAWVLPAQFTWCDVGNIERFLTLQTQYENLKTDTIELNAQNNLIQAPNKLVVIIGVDDICVVQSENILLITKKDQADSVKNIVNQSKPKNYQKYF